MSTEDCSGCDDHEEGCEESDGAGHVTHVQYPRGFDVDWDSDLLASAKPQPRQVSATLILSGFGYPKGSLARNLTCACLPAFCISAGYLHRTIGLASRPHRG
jgi:hypothetical protein